MPTEVRTSPVETTPIERTPTRILSGVVGGLFAVGPLVTPLIYNNQATELRTASLPTLLLFAAIYLVSATVGVLFLVVALTGKAPTWLGLEKN